MSVVQFLLSLIFATAIFAAKTGYYDTCCETDQHILVVTNSTYGPQACFGTPVNENWVLVPGKCVENVRRSNAWIIAGGAVHQVKTIYDHSRESNCQGCPSVALLESCDLFDSDVRPVTFAGSDTCFSDGQEASIIRFDETDQGFYRVDQQLQTSQCTIPSAYVPYLRTTQNDGLSLRAGGTADGSLVGTVTGNSPQGGGGGGLLGSVMGSGSQGGLLGSLTGSNSQGSDGSLLGTVTGNGPLGGMMGTLTGGGNQGGLMGSVIGSGSQGGLLGSLTGSSSQGGLLGSLGVSGLLDGLGLGSLLGGGGQPSVTGSGQGSASAGLPVVGQLPVVGSALGGGGSSSAGSGGLPVVGKLPVVGSVLGGSSSGGLPIVEKLPVVGGVLGGSSGTSSGGLPIVEKLPVVGGVLGGGSSPSSGTSSGGLPLIGKLPLVGDLTANMGKLPLIGGLLGPLMGSDNGVKDIKQNIIVVSHETTPCQTTSHQITYRTRPTTCQPTRTTTCGCPTTNDCNQNNVTPPQPSVVNLRRVHCNNLIGSITPNNGQCSFPNGNSVVNFGTPLTTRNCVGNDVLLGIAPCRLPQVSQYCFAFIKMDQDVQDWIASKNIRINVDYNTC